MKIVSPPNVVLPLTSGNWTSNTWGYSNWWWKSTDRFGTILSRMNEARETFKGIPGICYIFRLPFGCAQGCKPTADYSAAGSDIRTGFESQRFQDWMGQVHADGQGWGAWVGAARGQTLGNVFRGPPEIYCADVRDDAAQARFNEAYGRLLALQPDRLIIDNGTLRDETLAAAQSVHEWGNQREAGDHREIHVMSEAVAYGLLNQWQKKVPLFGYTDNLENKRLWDTTFDPTTEEVRWAACNFPEAMVHPTSSDLKGQADRGWRIDCVWPTLGAEIAALARTHPVLQDP